MLVFLKREHVGRNKVWSEKGSFKARVLLSLRAQLRAPLWRSAFVSPRRGRFRSRRLHRNFHSKRQAGPGLSLQRDFHGERGGQGAPGLFAVDASGKDPVPCLLPLSNPRQSSCVCRVVANLFDEITHRPAWGGLRGRPASSGLC
jgi:hypothetical protein